MFSSIRFIEMMYESITALGNYFGWF